MGGEPKKENPTTAMKVNAGSSTYLSTVLQTHNWIRQIGKFASAADGWSCFAGMAHARHGYEPPRTGNMMSNMVSMMTAR